MVRLPQEEQHRKRLPQGRHYKMQLLWREQPMPV
jgi:hypothetical protein